MAIQGLNTALTALYASQRAIDTTGNNIANANTEGYSRQRVNLSPTGSNQVAFWSTSNDRPGTGVTIDSIARLRDEFAERQTLSENGKQGQFDRVATTFASIEDAFGEPSDTGIQAQMADFLSDWDNIHNESDVKTVVEDARTLALGFQRAGTALDTIKSNSLDAMKTDVDQINSIAKSIANLNKTINTLVNTSGDANNLLDQRDQLVRQLSTMVDVTTSTSSGGQMNVVIGGHTLVRGTEAEKIDLDTSGSTVKLRWDDGDGNPTTGMDVTITGGDVGGYLDTINTIVPKYKTQLDTAANALITAVNTQHKAGYDMSGNAGTDFFTGTSAATMGVSTAIAANSKLAAIAKTTVGGLNDNLNAQAIAKLAEGNGGPLGAYKSLIATLGTESQRATSQQEIQSNITKSTNDARTSVSGVNIDEEMTNLIQFQHSYSAAAKYLSTMNEVLDSLLSIIR